MRLQNMRVTCVALCYVVIAGIVTARGGEIPFVTSDHDTVKDMLWMANVGKSDVLPAGAAEEVAPNALSRPAAQYWDQHSALAGGVIGWGCLR